MIILRQREYSLVQGANEAAIKRTYNLDDPNDRFSVIRREFKLHPNSYSKEFKLEVLKKDLRWLEDQERNTVDKKPGWRGGQLQNIKKEIAKLENN